MSTHTQPARAPAQKAKAGAKEAFGNTAAKPATGAKAVQTKAPDAKPTGKSPAETAVIVPAKAPSRPAMPVKAALKASIAQPKPVSDKPVSASVATPVKPPASATRTVTTAAKPQDNKAPTKKPEASAAKAVASDRAVKPGASTAPSAASPSAKAPAKAPVAQPLAPEAPAPKPPIAAATTGAQSSPAKASKPTSAPKAVNPAPANSNASPPKPSAQAVAGPPIKAVAPALGLVANATEPKAATPKAAAPAAEPTPAAATGSAPFSTIGGYASAFSTTSASLGEINEAVLSYVQGEREAALAHMTALAQVRSAGDLVRLQVGAFQRSTDASLACLRSIVRSATRFGSALRP